MNDAVNVVLSLLLGNSLFPVKYAALQCKSAIFMLWPQKVHKLETASKHAHEGLRQKKAEPLPTLYMHHCLSRQNVPVSARKRAVQTDLF